MKRIFAILASMLLWATVYAQENAPVFTIHLMGDSTMAPKKLDGGNPERGWGMMFPNFLDGDRKSVV